jgi:hypothetical protein
MRVNGLACAVALCVLYSGAAHALDAAPAGTSPGAPRAGGEDAAVRSAKSIECSQKADAQDLHGKPRKRFMRECKHGG